MPHPFQYSSSLRQNSTNLAETIEWIDALANLVLNKKNIMKNIEVKQLSAILASLDCPETVHAITVIMAENNDTSLLPKVAASLRRQLTRLGQPVLDIILANDDSSTKAKASQVLSQKYTLVFQSDPNLIAGMRIAGSNFTFESSVASRIIDIKNALSPSN